MSFHQATRKGVKPLIGLFGESGGGKTRSGLLLARGIAGPNGKIGLIDTENGRGSLFADAIPGGYLTLDLQPPFSPDAYAKALDEAEAARLDVLVIDSATHEWVGEGGYLDMKEAALDRMAGNDWKKREACKFAASAQCKPGHNKFVAKVLRCSMAVILCFRAKQKVKMEKTESEQGRAKTKIVADDDVSPIQDTGFIFEMLIAGEVYAREKEVNGVRTNVGGFFRCTKFTHESILPFLPREDEQIGIETGRKIQEWANGGSVGGSQSAPPATQPNTTQPQRPTADREVVELKQRLVARTAPHFNFPPDPKHADFPAGMERMKHWLYEQGILGEQEELGNVTKDRLREIVERVENELEAKF